MPNTGTASPTPGTAPCCGPADRPAGCEVRGVSFGYANQPAVWDVSFAVPDGRFLTLLGPSGCGKTTLLKLLGGYLSPQTGRVFVRGRDLTDTPPEGRNCGMVFQHYALFPHLSALRNVSFGLEVRGRPWAECRDRADAMLDRVGLTAAERTRRPAALSGGQQQRMALARALAIEPGVLLLDEPLANLDRRLREQLRGEIRRLQRETGVTTIMVTHDQDEALAVSDVVGVMAGGRLLQAGPPDEVYRRPRTPFVATALGDANLIPGPSVGLPPGRVAMARPEACELGGTGCRWSWPGVVAGTTFRGADTTADVRCDGFSLLVRVRGDGPPPGAAVRVGVPADALWPVPDPDPE